MKRDIIVAAIIGLFVSVFFLGILTNIQDVLPFEIPFPRASLLVFPILSAIGIAAAAYMGRRVAVLFQTAKFALVGSLNTFVDLGISNFLLFGAERFFQLETTVAIALFPLFKSISFILAMTNSYMWNKYWTFRAGDSVDSLGERRNEVFKFFGISGVGFFLNVGIASFLVNILGPQFGIHEKIWVNIAVLVATLIVMSWNFTGFKIFVFKK